MNVLKHKLPVIIASVLFCLFVLAPSVSAEIPQAESPNCPAADSESAEGVEVDASEQADPEACQGSTDCKPVDGQKLDETNCGIIGLIVGVTNILAGVAGVVIVGVMVWGGIQYSSAGADPSKVQAAKGKIINALVALLLLIFGWSLLQWLIPGGALNGFGYYY